MEDNSNYTYTYEKEEEAKPERSLKLIFAGVIVALAVLAIALGIFFGVRSASEPETTTEESTTEEITTVPVPKSPFPEGKYSVNTDGKALFFRKDHSKDSDTILEIDDKTELDIVEVFHDETAEIDDYMYWGKTTYKGHTGWVAMKYMKKAYSDNVVTPDDITTTTADESTTAGNEPTSETESTTILVLPENTTAQQASEEQTTAASTSKYSAGDYSVSTGGSTLSFRKAAGKDAEKILDIPDGTKLSVVEIVDIGAEHSESMRYWGKVSYNGYTGYVCMAYMKR